MNKIRQSAIVGNAEDAWRLACGYLDGVLYLDGGCEIRLRTNPRAGLSWMRKAAALGSSSAMNNLACILTAGEFCKVDLAQAMEWGKRAFESGDKSAAYNLAITCSMMSKPQACYQWLLTAADAGNEDSSLLLGICLYAGYGVRRDIRKARSAFRATCRCAEILDDDKVKSLKFINMMAHGRPLSCEGSIAKLEPEAFHDDLALETYRRARKNIRDGFAPCFCLGETLLRMNQADRALPYLRRCFEQGFCEDDSLRMLAEAYETLERVEDEVALYEAWLRKYPSDGFMLGNLGAAYIDQGRFEESLAASSQALKLISGDKRWIRNNIKNAKAARS